MYDPTVQTSERVQPPWHDLTCSTGTSRDMLEAAGMLHLVNDDTTQKDAYRLLTDHFGSIKVRSMATLFRTYSMSYAKCRVHPHMCHMSADTMYPALLSGEPTDPSLLCNPNPTEKLDPFTINENQMRGLAFRGKIHETAAFSGKEEIEALAKAAEWRKWFKHR